MIKIIYFDFGNILVTYDKVFNKICQENILNLDEFVNYYDSFEEEMTIGKISTDEFWKKCIKKFFLHKEAEKYDLCGAWVADYEIIKPINELIYKIGNRANIGIISNIVSGIWEAALRDGWVPNVNYLTVILSYQVGCKKPERNIYEIAQKRSGVNPEEILFVDDKLENLTEPNKMGWKTILFDPNIPKEGVKKILNFIS